MDFVYVDQNDIDIHNNNIELVKSKKILKMHHITLSIFNKYDYVITDNIAYYLTLKNKTDLLGKIIYINKNSSFFFANNNIKLNIPTTNLNEANTILYKNIDELQNIDITNKSIIKYDSYLDRLLPKLLSGNIDNLEKIITLTTTITNYPIRIKYIDYLKYNQPIKVKKGELYGFVRQGFEFYNRINPKEKEVKENHFNLVPNFIFQKQFYNITISSFIVNSSEKELFILYMPDDDYLITYQQLIKSIECQHEIIIGKNDTVLDDMSKKTYYYILGLSNSMFDNKFIVNIFDYYSDIIKKFISNTKITTSKKYDKEKFIICCNYYFGLKRYNMPNLDDFINKNSELFNTKQVALLTKEINSYGGNQKTSIQIYDILVTSGCSVKVICLGEKRYSSKMLNLQYIHNTDFEYTSLNNLPNKLNQFDYIIVNKLNEYFQIKNQVTKKDFIITHNSLDPFNNIIKNVNKVFTVNTVNIACLYDVGNNYPIAKHINYVDITNIVRNRTNFSYKVAYVGRFSKEKNVNSLLEAWNQVIEVHNNLELLIIGSGDTSCVKEYNNVKFLGQMELESILITLMNCDYLILPSYTEGLPFCALEAMSVGTPVITYNICGCDEIIFDGQTGFLSKLVGYGEYKYKVSNTWEIFHVLDRYSETNISNLRNTILKAYEIDYNKWKEMSNKCFELIENYHCYDVSRKNLLKILNNNIAVLICGTSKENINHVMFKEIIEETDYMNFDIIVSVRNSNIYDNMNGFLSKLYRLDQECIFINDSYKIMDRKGDFIVFANCSNRENTYNVDCIDDLFM